MMGLNLQLLSLDGYCHVITKFTKSIFAQSAITVSNLLEIESCNVCGGLAEKCLVGDVMAHVIPCEIDLQAEQFNPTATKQYSRYKNCLVLSSHYLC